MYKDEIKKIEYYKELLANLYIKDGIVLDNNEIQKKIDQLDLKLAIFQQGYIENGETMILEKFNEQKAGIYNDLKILYELCYETARDRLSKIQQKINYKLSYLNDIAKKYQNKTAIESIGLYGKTVYYNTNGFNQYYENGCVKIDLGAMTIDSGSYIACLLNSNEFSGSEKITFNFDDKYQVSEYTRSRNLLTMPGNYSIETYQGTISENINSSYEVLPAEEFKPKTEAKYNLFIKKNCISVTDYVSNQTSYVEKSTNIVYTAKNDCDITFYVYGASNINIEMNDKYESKSFSDNIITTPKLRQKIHIKASQGFMFDLETDGELYAEKVVCNIVDDKLYSSKAYGNENDKYMLEEVLYGDPVKFSDVTVSIANAVTTFYDLDYIAIKTTQVDLEGEDL